MKNNLLQLAALIALFAVPVIAVLLWEYRYIIIKHNIYLSTLYISCDKISEINTIGGNNDKERIIAIILPQPRN